MKRMLVTISYDGTAYHGWQVQPNGVTVQETVQKALVKLTGADSSVTGCSRTDAGVHAKEFCFHTDCSESLPETAFLKGLNALLPDDIAVKDCREVPPDFHARYNCMGKTYKYCFYHGVKDPFLERYALLTESVPDIGKMNEFCRKITGKHDFFGFSASGRTVEDTVRTVSDCKVYTEGNITVLEITADGFLYNMVRIIAGTALAVGYGRLNPDCADNIFVTKERAAGGDTLPGKALFLSKVYYNW